MSTILPELERALRAAADARTAADSQVPPAGRRRKTPVRLALGGLGAACVLAAIAVGLLLALSGARPQSAFAGWSPIPTQTSDAQTSAIAAACGARALQPPSRATPEQAASAADPGQAPSRSPVEPGGWETALVDTRGPYIMVILEAEEGRATTSCLYGPPAPNVPAADLAKIPSADGLYLQRGNASFAPTPPAPVPAGQVEVSLEQINGVTEEEQRYNARHYGYIEGRTGAGVTGVTVVLEDGTRVQATTAGGWFLAWWPNSERTPSAEVRTSAGETSIQQLGGEG